MDDADLYVPAEYIRWGDWEYPSGVEQGTELMKLNVRPTAIFAMNDTMAAGCYRAIKNHGLRIPADISVVGFDNREIAYLINPPMTTVELPNKQIGFQAANLLLARLKDSKVAVENIVLPLQHCTAGIHRALLDALFNPCSISLQPRFPYRRYSPIDKSAAHKWQRFCCLIT